MTQMTTLPFHSRLQLLQLLQFLLQLCQFVTLLRHHFAHSRACRAPRTRQC